jgi:leucyl aminopeptidase
LDLEARDLTTPSLLATTAHVLALPLVEDAMADPWLAALDEALGGLLERTRAEEEFSGKRGQSLLVHTHGKVGGSRVLLVGLGKGASVDEEAMRRFGGTVARVADKVRARRLAVVVPELGLDLERALAATAEGLTLGLYRFDRYLTQDRQELALEQAVLLAPGGGSQAHVLGGTRDLCRAVTLARDLVNEPASTLTPTRLSAAAREAAAAAGLSFEELGPRELAAEGMELLRAVSRASEEEPRLVRLAYTPAGPPLRKVALVGKGITFDAGGLDIKSAEGMADMKDDMAGAAAVLGALVGVAARRPQVAVTGYLACTENVVGARAYKPGDVLRSRAGLTVEVTNTDAEGRLVLADALSYAQDRDRPDELLDVATLTGACAVALGLHTAGLFTPHDDLAQSLCRAGEAVGEPCWRLPLTESLRESLKSPVADTRNTSTGRWGGAITAALFLQGFVKEGVRWAHLDVAGPAMTDKERDYLARGATGFGVRLLVRHLAG